MHCAFSLFSDLSFASKMHFHGEYSIVWEAWENQPTTEPPNTNTQTWLKAVFDKQIWRRKRVNRLPRIIFRHVSKDSHMYIYNRFMCVYLSIQEIICKYKYNYIYTQNEQLPYSTRKPLKESKTIDHLHSISQNTESTLRPFPTTGWFTPILNQLGGWPLATKKHQHQLDSTNNVPKIIYIYNLYIYI